MRIVVPKVSPGVKSVVARSGRRRATGRLRVLAPFRGKIGARPDRARAATATVGPDGGSISATGRDGTRYDLGDPSRRRRGGDGDHGHARGEVQRCAAHRRQTRGRHLRPRAPDAGTPRRCGSRTGRGVPKNAFGFTFDSSTGGSFAIARPKVAGAVVEVPVEHYSGAGSGLGNPQNFAAIVQAELNRLGNRRLTFGEAEELAGLIVQWASVFGPAFCGTQPVCGNAATIVLTNVKRLLADACPEGAQPPIATLTQIEQINRIESLRQQVDGLLTGPETGAGTDVPACHRRILRVMIDRAINGLSLYPAGSSKLVRWRAGAAGRTPRSSPQYPGLRASADIDDDGVVTAIEWLLFLAAQAATADDHERQPGCPDRRHLRAGAACCKRASIHATTISTRARTSSTRASALPSAW